MVFQHQGAKKKTSGLFFIPHHPTVQPQDQDKDTCSCIKDQGDQAAGTVVNKTILIKNADMVRPSRASSVVTLVTRESSAHGRTRAKKHVPHLINR